MRHLIRLHKVKEQMSCIVSPILLIFFFIVLVITCMVMETVHGQPSHEGFISIDCGISSDSTYTDSITNIPYVSDDKFITTGVKASVSSDYVTSTLERQLSTLRSFPDGSRNCYLLNVTQGQKYLVRASFMYGNYDGRDRASVRDPLLFDLYLDYNHWRIVKIVDANQQVIWTEAIFVASSDTVSVCLIKTGTGIPFISALELRPLEMDLYPYANATHTVALTYRSSLMPTTNRNIRFPDDIYDRIWVPFFFTSWTTISTNMTVTPQSGNHFRPPSAVMQTAATPIKSTMLGFYIDYENTGTITNQFFAVLHMSELLPNTNRAFDIKLNGLIWHRNYSPPYLVADCVFHNLPDSEISYNYQWSLDSSGLSKRPPILNAVEVFTPIYHTNVPTDSGDADAITTIARQYQLKKNWVGDPCAPKGYAWDGLNCSYTSNSTSIETVNLSSNALTGVISDDFGMFAHMKYLDLSYNNLTGKIPDALGTLSSLRVLNLAGNNLNGSVPDSLLQKSRNESLILILHGNPNLICTNGTSCEPTTDIRKGKKIPTRVIVIICVVPVAVFLLVSIFIWRRKEKTADRPLKPKTRPFTYLELKKITNNFENLIGKGGFGNVYRGSLNNGTPVAVKMRSQSSEQGTAQFFAEVQHLMRIHHKYLVSIHGYCMEGNCMALVYEYMANGNLRNHLIGKTVSDITSNWKKRLQVVIEAARGLEYLHHGCTPPLVHRDVKSENILLNGRLEAKIADFGLSKAIQNDTSNVGSSDSLMSRGIKHGVSITAASDVAGTLGYVDPQYCWTLEYSEKSDVFSFGVVLLELITGQPPILKAVPDKMVFIVNRMKEKLKTGNIEAMIDSRLQNIYDINSVWRSADLALQCTSDVPSERPTMTEVITQLNESLNLQTSHERSINFERNDGLQFGTSEMGQSLVLKMEEFSSPSAR